MAHPSYYVGGKRVPSVTTILGKFKDPGALMWWAHSIPNKVVIESEEVAKKAIDCLSRKKTAEANAHLSQYLLSKPIQRADYRGESTKATTAGTLAHDLVEAWIKSQQNKALGPLAELLDDISVPILVQDLKFTEEVATLALSSYQAFLRWVETNKFILLETETPLTSEEYCFGGCIDCIGYLGNDLILLDWKTSKKIYAEYIMQVAAYALLWNENYDPAVASVHIVQFSKTTGDFHHARFSNLDKATTAFLNLRECYDIVRELESTT